MSSDRINNKQPRSGLNDDYQEIVPSLKDQERNLADDNGVNLHEELVNEVMILSNLPCMSNILQSPRVSDLSHFQIGSEFSSFSEFESAKEKYEREHFAVLVKEKSEKWPEGHRYRDTLVYQSVVIACKKGVRRHSSQAIGLRRVHSRKLGCAFRLKLTSNSNKGVLQVKESSLEHTNHSPLEDSLHPPKKRRRKQLSEYNYAKPPPKKLKAADTMSSNFSQSQDSPEESRHVDEPPEESRHVDESPEESRLVVELSPDVSRLPLSVIPSPHLEGRIKTTTENEKDKKKNQAFEKTVEEEIRKLLQGATDSRTNKETPGMSSNDLLKVYKLLIDQQLQMNDLRTQVEKLSNQNKLLEDKCKTLEDSQLVVVESAVKHLEDKLKAGQKNPSDMELKVKELSAQVAELQSRLQKVELKRKKEKKHSKD